MAFSARDRAYCTFLRGHAKTPDLDEFLDSGALKSTTDANGRTAIKASELQRFHAALRPVYFAQTDEDADDDGDIDRDSATDEDTDTVPALTRRNPAEGDITEESGGWVRLRLNDLVRLIRDGFAEDAPETAPAASEPPAPSTRY